MLNFMGSFVYVIFSAGLTGIGYRFAAINYMRQLMTQSRTSESFCFLRQRNAHRSF